MINIALLVLAAIWLAGACLRIYRQARFYQIEEYMSFRYLRWVFADRSRWIPSRPLIAWLIGSIFAFMFSEAPDGFLPTFIGVISAIISVIPPDEGEIKKKFRATPRAKRLLGAAFAVATLCLLIGFFATNSILSDSAPEIRVIAVHTLGFAIFLFAPLWLIIANIILTPIEAAFRRRFIDRARKVLAEIHPVVIGITGSYGKTSVKSYLAHILNGRYHAYPTPKSYNTLMGICLAINNDLVNDHSVDYFIVEMGAYVPGEIQRICELTQPHISVVVEVGPQHLERFGTLENVAAAKYEIIRALPSDGVAVFNWDNPYIRQMAQRGYPQTRLTVSRQIDPEQVTSPNPRFIASEIEESLDGSQFRVIDTQTGASEVFTTPLLGEHSITNILLATAVAVHEGMNLREIARRVRDLQPAESRLVRQTTPQGITIINDAYSANPVGIVSALRVLGMHTSGRRLVITPGMIELGDLMERENRRLGEIAAQHATDVILVGKAPQIAPIKNGLIAANFPAEKIIAVETLAESVGWYQSHLTNGDTVLFLNDLPDTYTT
jgi:UDP-N-acetylmuramoyl-tripeptide--D-alanyl-D-alanine ligase